jgi:hypothetical protein
VAPSEGAFAGLGKGLKKQAGWMSSEGRILSNPTGYQLLEEFLVSEVN